MMAKKGILRNNDETARSNGSTAIKDSCYLATSTKLPDDRITNIDAVFNSDNDCTPTIRMEDGSLRG